VQRAQVPGGLSHPVRQCRTIEIDALAGINLGLPVQRQMIGIFGHQNLGDGGLGRQSAFDQPGRSRRLHDTVFARSAGVFGPPGDENAELRRYHVQPLAPVFADPVQIALATGAGLVVDIDDNLDPRQMRRQRAAVRAALASPRRAAIRRAFVLLCLTGCCNLLDVFKAQQHLVLGQRLRLAAKAMPLQFLDDLTQPLALAPLGKQHRFQGLKVIRQGVARHQQIRS